ncbi:alpha-L-arabinofuranosidase B [Streptomyces sp. NBC_01477]|uniref:alpha-L-arabinofuranosidase B n=1 Tax=Streptomyces sp. NBC_01477 TaxID=2976015 RepID=UPI002E35D334|nr:alpha-L-arabinofuranosidase B [Streptomyces sp. NBC_01477]
MSAPLTVLFQRQFRKYVLAAAAVLALIAGVLAGGSHASQAAGSLPCDIYASGGTPCVAAHSTTRALYSSYAGPLYQVRRSSDNTYKSFSPTTAGGYPDASAQDSFCSGTACVITRIYDQSGRGNDLTQAPGGGAAGGPDNLSDATAAPTTVGGHKAYGVYIAPGTGYRNDNTNGIATGDSPEGMYAIFDGTHYNGGCCFDYGNAETNNNDDGNGTMEAIYFGNIKVWGYGSGNGPWIMADLENGLFSGVNQHLNSGDPTVNYRYTTAIVKGEPNHWAIRGGNAQSGGLSTFYNGVRPNVSGYNPMKKQGAIILGIGGDNSKGAQGTFYEGVMTSGYPSDATENAVQANINSVNYGGTSSGGGNPGTLTPGSRISLQATTSCCTADYIKHDDNDTNVVIAGVSSSSSSTDKGDATWIVRAGLANGSCVSFESANKSGQYLRHQNYQLHLAGNDGSSTFTQDATFCPQSGHNGQGYSFQSANYTNRYLRHYDYTVYIASNGGSNTFDATTSWNDDTSWNVATPWS